MNKFHCIECGIHFIGFRDHARCPECGGTRNATCKFTYDTDEGVHGSEGIMPVESGLERLTLSLSVQEYQKWRFDNRCFWGGCAGQMLLNKWPVRDKIDGCCTQCNAVFVVFPK